MAQGRKTPTPTYQPIGGRMLNRPYRVWDGPGAPNIGRPPTPGQTGRLRVDLTREYVSSQPNQWYLNLVRVLPFSIDDVTQDFGDDLYQRMLFDPIVSSAVMTLKAAVLEEGLHLRPCITDSTDKYYDLAVKMHDEAEALLADYPANGIDDWLWEAADAIWRGNTASEVTFRLDTTITGRKQYFLERLSSKPPHTYGFAVDSFKRVIGVMGLIPGIGMPVYTGSVIMDPEKMPNMLPREKFAIYSHRPRDEDPRGTSALRPVYIPWQLKMQLIPAYAKWLAQFASPTLLGFTAEDAMSLPLQYPNGDPIQGTDGSPIQGGKTPEETMLDSLVKVASGVAAVFPGGSKVTPIEMRGMGNPFLFAFKWIDEQINTGVNGQTMTSMAPKYGTQALGGVQENTFDTIVHQIKSGISRMFWRDVLRLWVRENFGTRFLPFTPSVSLGHVEEQDINADLNAFAQAGYTLHSSQFGGIDQRLGMPVRAPDWENDLTPPSPTTAAGKRQSDTTKPQSQPTAQEQSTTKPSTQNRAEKTDEQKKQDEKVKQAEEERRNQRWHEMVYMAGQLKQVSGIELNPDLPPPSMEVTKWFAGVS